MLITDSTRARDLAWLASPAGESMLAAAAALPDDRLTRLNRLRSHLAPELAATAVELLELRRRARAKFDDPERMLFTPEGLEQATGDRIAAHRSRRFAGCSGILDACCGIGGDARQFRALAPVLAVDRNPAAVVCTLHNRNRLAARCVDAPASTETPTASRPRTDSACSTSTRLPNEPPRDSGMQSLYPLRALCADVTSIPLQRLRDGGFDAVFFDPSRRGTGRHGERQRVRTEDYDPPLAWIDALRSHFRSVGAKVSPAIEDAALLHQDVRVEFMSDRGECKEAVLWFGQAAESLSLPPGVKEPYFATVLAPDRSSATLAPFVCPPLVSAPPREYLYEPNPAVIRAHLVGQIAAQIDAAEIEPGIAYITSDQYSPTPFATVFRIIESRPFVRKDLQRRLRELGAHVSVVKKRGVPFEPDEVRQSLAPYGDRALELVLTRRLGKTIAILCERINL